MFKINSLPPKNYQKALHLDKTHKRRKKIYRPNTLFIRREVESTGNWEKREKKNTGDVHFSLSSQVEMIIRNTVGEKMYQHSRLTKFNPSTSMYKRLQRKRPLKAKKHIFLFDLNRKKKTWTNIHIPFHDKTTK